jgi:glycosyltransferase involved in cell wall biosynthesis
MSQRGHVALFMTDVSGGGAERVMVNLSSGIAAQGYRVDLLLAKKEGVYLDLIPQEVRIVDLQARSAMLTFGKVARYLQAERPDALISALNQPNTVAVIAKRLARVPTKVIVCLHNTLISEVEGATNYKRKIMPYFAKRFFPWADEIVSVSRDSALSNAHFLGVPESRVRPVLNPVITPVMRLAAKEPVEHPWFGSGQPPVILGMGRLTRQKNFEMLIRAFKIVREQADARLVIFGEGEDRADLERLVGELSLDESVALPGFVKNPYAHLAKARVFALSSNWEGLPTVLIESLGCGTPTVSTDCPSGPKEILADGKYGALTPMNDPEAFAEALLTELAKPKKAPPREAYAPYELERVTKEYLSLVYGDEQK